MLSPQVCSAPAASARKRSPPATARVPAFGMESGDSNLPSDPSPSQYAVPSAAIPHQWREPPVSAMSSGHGLAGRAGASQAFPRRGRPSTALQQENQLLASAAQAARPGHPWAGVYLAISIGTATHS